MSMRGCTSYSIVAASPVHAACTAVLTLVICTWCCDPTPAQARQPGTTPCGGEELVRGTASVVSDGRTFTMNDGREVRLAAVEMPPIPFPKESDPAPGGAETRDTLNALIGGDEVVLRQAGAATDRYGRTVAYAYAVRDGEELFAQGELTAAGYARVGSQIGSQACAVDLLAREQAARGPALASGPFRIMTCSTPRPLRMYWRGEADLRWSRAK